jgi:hypothetical protein
MPRRGFGEACKRVGARYHLGGALDALRPGDDDVAEVGEELLLQREDAPRRRGLRIPPFSSGVMKRSALVMVWRRW